MLDLLAVSSEAHASHVLAALRGAGPPAAGFTGKAASARTNPMFADGNI
jgi:hypothetical protein